MVEKLKSIIGPIPWSLILRAVLFGAAWLVLPFWVFLAVSILIYFIPFFRPALLLIPLSLTLILAALVPPSFWAAAFLSVLFFFILGIKDLIFVDRATAFNLLVLVLFFLMWLYSFSWFDAGITAYSIMWFGVCSLIFFVASRQFLSYALDIPDSRKLSVSLGVVSFMLWEASVVALFMPLNFLFSTALVFLFAAMFLECAADYFKNRISPSHLLAYFSVFFVLLVIILSSANFIM